MALVGDLALERVERRGQLGERAVVELVEAAEAALGAQLVELVGARVVAEVLGRAAAGGRTRRAGGRRARGAARRSARGASPAPRRASSARARSARPWATRRTYDTASSSSCSSRRRAWSSSRLSSPESSLTPRPPTPAAARRPRRSARPPSSSSAGVAVDPDPARRQDVGERRAVPRAGRRRARRRPSPRAARRGPCRRPPGPRRTCARSPRGERTHARIRGRPPTAYNVPMSVHVLCVRHGLSTWNLAAALAGPGRSAAERRGPRRRRRAGRCPGDDRSVTVARVAVWSSDLQRAAGDRRRSSPSASPPDRSTIDGRLRETDVGPWEGLTSPEIEAGLARLPRRRAAAADGFEPEADAARPGRCPRSTTSPRRAAGGAVPIVVAHAGVLRAVRRHARRRRRAPRQPRPGCGSPSTRRRSASAACSSRSRSASVDDAAVTLPPRRAAAGSLRPSWERRSASGRGRTAS